VRELAKNIDADLVLAVARYLDDHGRSTPVSLGVAIPEIRNRQSTRLSNKALEELILQMAATRGLSVLLDNHH
jgi:hypothetical protein